MGSDEEDAFGQEALSVGLLQGSSPAVISENGIKLLLRRQVWVSEAVCTKVVCHSFQNKKLRKLSYSGQVPSQPSGTEEDADKCDALIHSAVWYIER